MKLKLMIRTVFIFIVATLSMLFVSCTEEESPIRFKVESNSNPADVKVEYYSVDPCCIAKDYHIEANGQEAYVTLICTNRAKLFFGGYMDALDLDKNVYHSDSGYWTATIEDGNIIKIHFEKVSSSVADDELYSHESLPIFSYTDRDVVSTAIHIMRIIAQ